MRIDLAEMGHRGDVSTILVLARRRVRSARRGAAATGRRSCSRGSRSARRDRARRARDSANPRGHRSRMRLRGKATCTRRSVSFRWISLRRSAAGELAELFGERALPLDRAQRQLRFRARARELAAALPPQHAAWLAAYVEGVNAGLADLRARPPEYWVARPSPCRGRSRTACSSCSRSSRCCRTTNRTSAAGGDVRRVAAERFMSF